MQIVKMSEVGNSPIGGLTFNDANGIQLGEDVFPVSTLTKYEANFYFVTGELAYLFTLEDIDYKLVNDIEPLERETSIE